MELFLNNLTEEDGNINVFTNIRPNDDKLYLCDKNANTNVDIVTAFLAPVDMDI